MKYQHARRTHEPGPLITDFDSMLLIEGRPIEQAASDEGDPATLNGRSLARSWVSDPH